MSLAQMVEAVQAVEAVELFRAKQRIPEHLRKYSFFGDGDFWDFTGPEDTKTCNICYNLRLTMPFVGSRIRGYFPYLVILDANTIGGPGPNGDGLEHPNCRHRLRRYTPIDLYPKITSDKTLPSFVAKKKVAQHLDELPTSHLAKLKYIDVKDNLVVRGQRVAGAYHRQEDKIEFDFDSLDETQESCELIYHEVGHHVYDDILDTRIKREWQYLWRKTKSAMPNSYAKTSSSEGFAECYQHYMRGKLKKDTVAEITLNWWFNKNVEKGNDKK